MFILKVEGSWFTQATHATKEAADTEAARLADKEGRTVSILGVIDTKMPAQLYRVVGTLAETVFRGEQTWDYQAASATARDLRELGMHQVHLESRVANGAWNRFCGTLWCV